MTRFLHPDALNPRVMLAEAGISSFARRALGPVGKLYFSEAGS